MKILIKVLASLLLLSSLAYAHHLKNRDQTVVIGYPENWAPYSYRTETGVAQGIFVHLMNKIFKEKLNLRVIHQVIPWKRAQMLTSSGQYDAIFTQATKQRLKTLLETKSFYNLEWRLFMSKSNHEYENLQSMENPLKEPSFHYLKVLGDETTQNFYNEYGLHFDTVKSVHEAVNMLDSGRSSLFMHSKLTTLYALYNFNLQDKITMHPKVYSKVPFSILISKKAQEAQGLVHAINEVVSELQKSGELKKFIEQIEEKEISKVLEKSGLH